MKLRTIWKDQGGNSTPLTIAVILSLLLLCLAISEFFRLGIIVGGVRDGLQSAVIATAATNYDELYNGLREGYSGGYILFGSDWQENVDYGDVYGRLDGLLGTKEQDGYHVKVQKSQYEYRISKLNITITNVPFTPGNANRNFEADVTVTLEIPLSFGWEILPPLKIQVRTKAAYMPKF